MASFLGKISEKYICMSSSVSVYRNLKDFLFKNYLTDEDEIKVYNKICTNFYKLPCSDRFVCENLNSKNDCLKYFKMGVIFDDNTVYTKNSYILKRDDNLCFLKINCSEHLEMIGKIPGVNFLRASNFSYMIESSLEEMIDFSFNTKLGYLFGDINLLGNGLKMNCLLHLPALNHFKFIDIVNKKAMKKGIIMSSLEKYGFCKDFYKMEFTPKNVDEIKIIRNMDKFILEIVDLERENRRRLMYTKEDSYKEFYEKYKIIISKKITNEKILSSFISICLLLQSMEIIEDYDFKKLNNLLMDTMSIYFLEEKQDEILRISKALQGGVI